MRYHGLCALMLVMLAGAGAPGGAEEAARLESRVTRAALFKNGVGFFVREGELPAAKTVKLGPFAAPAHGTFWVSYPQQVALTNLVAREVTVTEEAPIVNLAELLRANVGREVEVVLNRPEAKAVRGRLLSFSEDRQQGPDDPYGWGRGSGRRPGSVYYDAGLQSRVALIETADGVAGVDTNAVVQATVLGDGAAAVITRKSKGWEMEVRLAKPSPGMRITASYLAKGITWAPSYIVDISDPSKARISAKAEVINEAEALDDVHLDLVTGFPNLRFADMVSPMAGKETLAQFLAALARGASERGAPGAAASVTTQAAGAFFARADVERGVMPEYGAAAAGAPVEDLFFYPLERVALDKGETAYFPLFTASAPYSEIYQWSVADYLDEQDRYGYRPGSEQRQAREAEEAIWHSLRLTNQTKMPWTTAPAQTVKSGQILGQDVIAYTSPATQSVLKITRAMGIKAEQVEFETGRQREAGVYYGYSYDRLTAEGRLRVFNATEKAVGLEVAKHLSGEVKQTTPEAKVERTVRGLARMNPTHVLTWEFTLQPGEQKELTYTYEVLIRR